MFIRVTKAINDPSKLDEVLAVVREAGLTRMRESPGFRNASVGVDRATGGGVVVSTWDTLEQASFVNSPEFVARLQSLGTQAEPSAIYEVTDQI